MVKPDLGRPPASTPALLHDANLRQEIDAAGREELIAHTVCIHGPTQVWCAASGSVVPHTSAQKLRRIHESLLWHLIHRVGDRNLRVASIHVWREGLPRLHV
eukprot:CAMPEP_0174723760 /NCGR_PEP_ID=MMETSP1094-20130205/41782_1 /TAXON_ID=156173 /ORGANISM="Chrysochromulina brevifilum, Strain UTEX LB 985" /LENGTH=101 /DNA_ID=CAMNT_0015924857 /DNA_START=232 /DNA_END=537 /DNA_ORIENTATION=+